MAILTTLFVTTSFSLCSLTAGGGGIKLLISSATLTPKPFWKRFSKMFWSESLFEETYDLLSWVVFLFFYADLPR